MGRILLFALSLFGAVPLFAQGTWLQRASLTLGPPRWGVAEFAIDGVGYVVGGRSASDDLNEVRAYIAATDTWETRASIPVARRLASAFVLGGKGYVTCGLVGTASSLNDLWEYDPATNSWTQKASLPAASRYSAASFSLDGVGYLVCGNLGSATGPYSTELWAYDPVADAWNARAPLPALARFAARGFTAAGKGYLFGGRLSDQSFSNGLWAYEAESDTWTSRTALPGIPRTYSFVWSLPEQAVVMGGDDLGFSNLQDCWYYDPLSDAWSPLAPYTGDAFWGGSSMVINGRIFAGLGRYGTNVAFDYWELKDLDTGLNTLVLDELRIGPNPVRPGSAITIVWPTGSTGLSAQLELHNAQGQLVHRARLHQQAVATTVLPTLPAGQYFASLIADGQVRARSLLMVVD